MAKSARKRTRTQGESRGPKEESLVDQLDATLRSGVKDLGATFNRETKEAERNARIIGRHFLLAQQQMLRGFMEAVEHDLARIQKSADRAPSERIKVD